MTSPRLLAAKLISTVLQRQASLGPIPVLLEGTGLSEQDKRFVSQLCLGTVRYYYRLAYMAQRLLSKPATDLEPTVYALLLTALYQLDALDIPEYAVVNETVSAAAALKLSWAKGLLNACLRKYLREKQRICEDLEGDDVARYAHPAWLIRRFKQDWPLQWRSLLAFNNQRPPLCLRVNPALISREDYLACLAKAGLEAEAGEHAPDAIVVLSPVSAAALPPPHEGVYVQDQSAQLAAHILDVQPNERVLDACSAPGGKALHILQYQPALKALVAVEKQAKRFTHLQSVLAPYALQAVAAQGDALTPDAWWDGALFDCILLDAPCSATGVIRRHPDIKLLRQAKDINAQVLVQRHLLEALWPLLKPGGRLLYSTCSVLAQENVAVVADFMANTPDCQEKLIEANWGAPCDVGRQILPVAHMDGFYYACLVKRC